MAKETKEAKVVTKEVIGAVTVKNATPEQRKKWTEKAKRTRIKRKNEKENLFNGLMGKDLKELLAYTDKIDFGVRALKAGKTSQREKEKILEILYLIEKI